MININIFISAWKFILTYQIKITVIIHNQSNSVQVTTNLCYLPPKNDFKKYSFKPNICHFLSYEHLVCYKISFLVFDVIVCRYKTAPSKFSM